MKKRLFEQEGASFLRFNVLLEEVQRIGTGRIFVVDLKEVLDGHPGHPHLVLVLPSGSVACSCGEMADWGAFDRHAFVLIRERIIPFVPLVHLHPNFLTSVAREFVDKGKAALEAKGDNRAEVSNTLGASWNEALDLTKSRWDHEGLCKSRQSFYPTLPLVIAPTRADKYHTLMNRLYRIAELAKIDRGTMERAHAFADTEDNNARRRAADAFVVNGQLVRPPATLPRASSNRKPSFATFRYKAGASSSKRQKK
mmetsp:Transcript_18047/g.45648  ORF Transcript_18047/g.45648 Transcript_18047/m.45648 type:complete len:254 (+) Transcript_18047:451-1212(+)